MCVQLCVYLNKDQRSPTLLMLYILYIEGMFIIIIAKYCGKARTIANSINISILCGNKYFENKNFV